MSNASTALRRWVQYLRHMCIPLFRTVYAWSARRPWEYVNVRWKCYILEVGMFERLAQCHVPVFEMMCSFFTTLVPQVLGRGNFSLRLSNGLFRKHIIYVCWGVPALNCLVSLTVHELQNAEYICNSIRRAFQMPFEQAPSKNRWASDCRRARAINIVSWFADSLKEFVLNAFEMAVRYGYTL